MHYLTANTSGRKAGIPVENETPQPNITVAFIKRKKNIQKNYEAHESLPQIQIQHDAINDNISFNQHNSIRGRQKNGPSKEGCG